MESDDLTAVLRAGLTEGTASAVLQAAMTQWAELEELAAVDTGKAHDAIGSLEVEELRFLVYERVLRAASPARAVRERGEH